MGERLTLSLLILFLLLILEGGGELPRAGPAHALCNTMHPLTSIASNKHSRNIISSLEYTTEATSNFSTIHPTVPTRLCTTMLLIVSLRWKRSNTKFGSALANTPLSFYYSCCHSIPIWSFWVFFPHFSLDSCLVMFSFMPSSSVANDTRSIEKWWQCVPARHWVLLVHLYLLLACTSLILSGWVLVWNLW